MLIATYNLVEAKARLEAQTGREVRWRELAAALDITPSTMSVLKNGAPKQRVELNFVWRVMDHFRAHGLDLAFDDLVSIVETHDEPAEASGQGVAA